MFWFHILILSVLVGSLLSSIGLLIGVVVAVAQGASDQSLEGDPIKNGTLAIYTMMIICQVLLLCVSIFGLILCMRARRNLYQLDKILRNQFTVWLVLWAVTFLGILAVGAYAITRSNDSVSQLSDLYETFKDHLLEASYIASFLKYQIQNNCCGVYGADDWLVAQLQNSHSVGELNPTTGKCHLSEDTIPEGCGQDLVRKIGAKLMLYGILTLLELIFGVAAGVAAAFSFCHWLNHEVMVIPEDEVGEVVIVEPPKGIVDRVKYGHSRDTVMLGPVMEGSSQHMYSKSKKFGQSRRDMTITTKSKTYAQYDGYGHGQWSHTHGTTPDVAVTESQFHGHHAHGSHVPPPGMKSIYRPDNFSSGSVKSFVEVPSPTPEAVHHDPSTPHQTKSHAPPADHEHSGAGPQAPPPSQKQALLEKEEKAVLKGALHGGKVIGEMHVEHKFDKDGKPVEDPNDKKRATLMIVRNKKVTKPLPPPGHHGQTGHLAEDIAEMSGKNAKTKIEDVVIPDLQGKHHHKERELETAKSKKIVFGSVTGDAAQADIENLINPVHLKAEEEKKEKKHEQEADVIKPHYLSLEPQAHAHHHLDAGSTIPIPMHPLEHHVNSHLHVHGHEHEHYIPEEHREFHDHEHHDHYLHHEHEQGQHEHPEEEHHHPTGYLHEHEHEHHQQGHEGHEHEEHHHPEHEHGHEHEHQHH